MRMGLNDMQELKLNGLAQVHGAHKAVGMSDPGMKKTTEP